MTTVDPLPLDDTAPCLGCSMCCDGTLYVNARVGEGEEERIIGHGLTITTQGDRRYFRLACPKESCGRCTIYEDRFEICRTFRCALLKRYQEREVDLVEAREKVSKAKELLAAVVADNPEAAHVNARRRIRDRLANPDGWATDQEGRRNTARQLLNIIALDVYLETWFRNRKDQPEEAVPTKGSNS